MAEIKYLVNQNLTNNQLVNFKVQNATSDPTGLTGEGQLIYRTDSNELKYHTGSDAWVSLSSTVGTVTSVAISSTNSTITVGGGPITSAGTLTVDLPVTGVTAASYTSANFTVDTYGRITAASDGGAGTMTSWNLAGDSGTPQVISNGNTASILGGTFLSTAASATGNVTADLSATNTPTATNFLRGDNTWNIPAGTYGWTVAGDTGSNDIESGDELEFVGGTGITTAVSGLQVTITNSAPNTNTTYTLPVSAGAANTAIITLDASSGTDSTVTFAGTTSEIAITETVGNDGTITIGLPDDVVIGQDLTITRDGSIGGSLNMTNGKINNLLAGTASTDAVNKAQLDAAVVGLLEFKGGFNAATGEVTSGANSGSYLYNCPGGAGTRIEIEVGDFYVVTVDGDFYCDATETLTVGDQVLVNTAAAANASVIGDWSIVQGNIDIATATTVGIASFPVAGGLAITAAGAVSLANSAVTAASYGVTTNGSQKVPTITVNAKGIVTAADDALINITASQVSDFCDAVEVCAASNLTYAVSIGDGSATSYVVTHNLGTRDVMVQLYDNSTYDTVYAEVIRDGVNTVTITTTSAIATNDIRVLVSKTV
tara:strand:- start:48 stop:1850 length:1803 start_codon:yes stop_codon:yes gene_type:complete